MAIWTILLTTSTARRRDKIDGSLLSIHRGLSTSGKHHFTSDGVRYFSPLCQQCIAARADANGVDTLNVINADDESNPDLNDVNDLSFDLEAATKFTDFNCNDLGRCHSSIHVRQCKSTTCTTCQKEKGVYVVNSYL